VVLAADDHFALAIIVQVADVYAEGLFRQFPLPDNGAFAPDALHLVAGDGEDLGLPIAIYIERRQTLLGGPSCQDRQRAVIKVHCSSPGGV